MGVWEERCVKRSRDVPGRSKRELVYSGGEKETAVCGGEGEWCTNGQEG